MSAPQAGMLPVLLGQWRGDVPKILALLTFQVLSGGQNPGHLHHHVGHDGMDSAGRLRALRSESRGAIIVALGGFRAIRGINIPELDLKQT